MPPRHDPATSDAALLRLLAAGGAVAPRRRLLEGHGTPEAALAAGPSGWRRAGLDDAQVGALARPGPGDPCTQDWLAVPGHHLVGWHHADYPALLRQAPNPPLALFVDGDPDLLWHPAIAMVGSRNPTSGGRDNARHFASAFAASGLAVCSGLAAGVDAAAHEAVLDAGGITVAVLGSGIDVPYPSRHASLHARIAATGAVVSEHPPGTAPRREHFPSRNRIIAGLALGTLVIEAAQRSGALITARLAAEAGREVFALPGSIHNPMARGCHRLIRDGAALVESADEVAVALASVAAGLGHALRQRLGAPIPGSGSGARADAPAPSPGDPRHELLWSALGHDPIPMDGLVERTGLTAAELSSMLLVMELEGRIACEHGRYSRKTCHTALPGAGRGK